MTASRVYYVIVVNGVPEAVTTLYSRALGYARELETRNRSARIVPTAEIVDDFSDEEPTLRDLDGDQRPTL